VVAVRRRKTTHGLVVIGTDDASGKGFLSGGALGEEETE
jgi:hypothetical protein